METSLLTTKLVIPPARPQFVPRSRLTERLQEGLKYNLILVSAPAGFGKTTLLSEWARQSQPQMHTAWVSLDEGDNDPTRFWDYFITALQALQPACGESALALLRSSEPPPVEELLTVLINELAVISFEFVLILDDYHVITSQPVHDGIAHLLNHLPSQMHLVIASRADPPLPLARFRGKGMLLEIRTDDLRFTRDEAVALLKEMNAPELSDDDAGALDSHTEGWAVGLKMAALAMQRQPDIHGFLASFTGSQRYIMDYLMEEVLRQQSDELQEFLLKTSVLERLTAPLCDFITGRSDSQDMILKLENDNLFIVPLDESRQWYRYEHLFADLLRHQCEKTYRTEGVAELYRQASQWHEDNHFPDEAIQYALAARDWENAARLITKWGDEKRKIGECTTLLNWLSELPANIIQSNPYLCGLHCLVLMTAGQLDAAESKLKILEKAAQSDDNIKGDVTDLQTLIAWRREDFPLAEELARKALSLLPPEYIENRGSLIVLLGFIQNSRGNLEEAESLLTKGYEMLRQAGGDYLAFNALSILAMIVANKGKLRRAAEMHRQVIELAGASPAADASHLLLSVALYQWNDLEAAEYHVQRAIELARLMGYPERLARAHHHLAIIRLARGDEAGALDAAEKADSEAQKLEALPSFQAEHAAAHILFALRQDNLATASEWGEKLARDLGSLTNWHFFHVPAYLLIAQGQKPAAAEKLQALYEKLVQSGNLIYTIRVRMYQAMAADTEESALEFLVDALDMGEPEGAIRAFVDEGRLLAPILRKAISRGIKPEYAGKLLSIIEAEERRRKKATGREILLSERELEILKLLAADVSNQQIADNLSISLSTVKTHVHHILEKLDVKDRNQAVFQARELELI